LKLPVEPERLKRSFPSLTDEDLVAYSATTKALLGEARSRGRRLAEILSAAQRAREKEAAAVPLDDDERLSLAYVRALDKMQGG
jgi:septal ring factor EnvC (AmiA/AmiB activator)